MSFGRQRQRTRLAALRVLGVAAVPVISVFALGGGIGARVAETTTTTITARPTPPGPPETQPTPPSTNPPPPPTTARARGSQRRRMTVNISDRYLVIAAVRSTAGRPVPRDRITFHLSGPCGTLKPTTSRTDRHG